MNERIQALADEAEDYADGIVDQGGEFHPAYTKKFAELIVRECMKAADEGMAQVTMKVEWPSYHIKKHFGVEE